MSTLVAFDGLDQHLIGVRRCVNHADSHAATLHATTQPRRLPRWILLALSGAISACQRSNALGACRFLSFFGDSEDANYRCGCLWVRVGPAGSVHGWNVRQWWRSPFPEGAWSSHGTSSCRQLLCPRTTTSLSPSNSIWDSSISPVHKRLNACSFQSLTLSYNSRCRTTWCMQIGCALAVRLWLWEINI